MVNGESGCNEKAMGMSGAVWSLLFYLCAILVWNVYRFQNKTWAWLLRTAGAIGLILLGLAYRGGEDGLQRLSPQWWGILGLIGWAYLFSCIICQLLRGRIILLLLAVAICIAWYTISRSDAMQDIAIWQWMAARSGHAAHTSIVLCGIVLSLLFFDEKISKKISLRFVYAGLFALAAAIAGYLLRPYYTISKIYATPTWCLYSVAICTILFSLLYWLTDVKKMDRWTVFFQPAASNPLLVYILPGIIMYLQIWLGLYFMPATFHEGILGIAWSLCYAVLVMFLAMGLNKLKIRLQL
jgi:predicted acyltransferase